MKVNCLSCGYNINLPDSYSNYEGLIKCFACGALLEIKTVEDELKSVGFKSIPQKIEEKSVEQPFSD